MYRSFGIALLRIAQLEALVVEIFVSSGIVSIVSLAVLF